MVLLSAMIDRIDILAASMTNLISERSGGRTKVNGSKLSKKLIKPLPVGWFSDLRSPISTQKARF
jgi:hypothetical protein